MLNTFSRLFLLLIFFLLFFQLSAQFTLKGVITDNSGNPLPNTSVFVKGSSNGTLANEKGEYFLSVSSGNFEIVFQHLGYKQLVIERNVNDNLIIDVSLVEESISIKEVEIKSGIDPSIPIMKKAIANRLKNSKKNKAFTSELYIKALMKIIDAPKMFFGNEVGSMDGALDSSRQGIIYLSESISNIHFYPPNLQKEILISSKVSGDSKGLTFNQFDYANFNLYNENIDFFRDVISPLNDAAFDFYNFYLYETFTDINNNIIHKIRVKPKSAFRPCFNGFIYIAEGLYNLQSVDLNITGTSIKNSVIDTINLHQVFVPLKNNEWYLITQTLSFKVGIFGFKMRGSFNYIFKNYAFENTKEKSFFNSERYIANNNAIKNDSTFWSNQRPIPLTEEEYKDYIKKDSIEKVVNSPAYLDSVDRKNNRFKLYDLIFGYNASISAKNIRYGITAPINSIQFNAIEGWNISTKLYYRDENKEGLNALSLSSTFKYGITDKRIKANLKLRKIYNSVKLSSFSVDIGNEYFQLFEKAITTEVGNTYQSLWFKNNLAKFFLKKYANLGWQSEILNGLVIQSNFEWAQRSDLDNNTNYSIRKKDLSYTPNHPNNLPDKEYTFNDRIFMNEWTIRYSPFQKYNSYPGYRIRQKSDWPDIILSFKNAFNIGPNYVNYSHIKLGLNENYLSTKLLGYMKYRMEMGKFITMNKVNFIDIFHFNKTNNFSSTYLNSFKLIKAYQLSSDKPYFSAWFEQHLDGYINDKIPILNKLGLTGVYSFNTLQRSDINYTEIGVGVEGIKISAIDLFRLDYYWAFENGKFKDRGLKIGYNVFIENILNRR